MKKSTLKLKSLCFGIVALFLSQLTPMVTFAYTTGTTSDGLKYWIEDTTSGSWARISGHIDNQTTSIDIPKEITIGSTVYYVKFIDDSAFYNFTSLKTVTIPDSVIRIGNLAFYYCTSLTTVTIPNSVTSIGNGAFKVCTSLNNVTIPNSVTIIGNSVFEGCTSLTNVTIPNSVTSIDGWTFYGCTSLTGVTIPNSVTSIGDSAFADCLSLNNINAQPVNAPVTALTAFENVSATAVLSIPNEAQGYNAAPWTQFAPAQVSKTTPVVDTAVSATSVSIGQTLSNSTLSGTFKVSSTDSTSVSGTLAWNDSITVVNSTGDYPWTFTPNDTTRYDVVTGTVSITAMETPTAVVPSGSQEPGYTDGAELAAPTGLIGCAPSTLLGNDGYIVGGFDVNLMEYKLVGDTSYTAVTASNNFIVGLSTGTYNVRYAARDGFYASADATVTIPLFLEDTIETTLHYQVSNPPTIGIDDTGYDLKIFPVTVLISNDGFLGYDGVSARIDLPQGLKLVAGQTDEISVGNVEGRSFLTGKPTMKKVEWKVEVEPSSTEKVLTYSVVVRDLLTYAKAETKDIRIPAFSLNGNCKKVVIIVPGICGTEMRNSSSTDILWMPEKHEHAHDIGALRCDEYGASVNIINLGDPFDKFYGHMYKTILANNDDGYIPYYFKYDWRMSCAENAWKLETFINEKTQYEGVNRVDILAHSMGGLIAAKYIANGNNYRVKKLITYGTPYLGSPKTLYTFETGNFVDEFLSDFIAGDEFREVAPNFASVYELLPSAKYFDYYTTYVMRYHHNTWPAADEHRGPIVGYSAVQEQIEGRGWVNHTLLSRARSFQENTDLLRALNSVESYFFIGDSSPTIAGVELEWDQVGYTGKYEWSFNLFDRVNEYEVRGLGFTGGDGTVPFFSQTIGNLISEVNPENTHIFFIQQSHSGLMDDLDVMNQTMDILKGDKNKVEGRIRTTPLYTNFYKIVVECPVNVNVYNSENKHVGPTSDTGYEEQILGSSYYVLGDKKIIALTKGNYNVQLAGTDNGNMTYSLVEYDSNGNIIKTVRFDDVPITAQTKINSNTDIDGEVLLNIDQNSDGIVETTLKPTVILDEKTGNDYTPPTVSFDISGQTGENGWYTSDVNVKVNASDDNSGVKCIQYSINGSELKTCNGNEISLTEEGVNNLLVRVVDKNNNGCNSEIKEIKVDKTAPTITWGTPTAPNSNGWNNTDVSYPFTVNDNVSGINSSKSTASPLTLNTEGDSVTENVIVYDMAGNSTTNTSQAVKIDKTVPEVKFDQNAPITYLLNQQVSLSWTATDNLSGLSTPASGSIPLPTNTVGPHSVTVTATDIAGNSKDYIFTYKVYYVFEGFLQPINTTDTRSEFKYGSTIPVKFVLKDASGVVVDKAVANISVQLGATGDSAAINEELNTSSASTGTLFIFDNGQYIFNLGTKNLTPNASYTITATLDDSSPPHSVVIGVRK